MQTIALYWWTCSSNNERASLFVYVLLRILHACLLAFPLGARVDEYAGRICLASTAQMQMSWFPEQGSGKEIAEPRVFTTAQGTVETCGVGDEELQGERRWWQSAGRWLASSASSTVCGTSSYQVL